MVYDFLELYHRLRALLALDLHSQHVLPPLQPHGHGSVGLSAHTGSEVPRSMTMSFDTRTARPESPLNEPDRLDRSRRPPVPSVVGMGARALFDTTCPSQPASKHTVCASRTMQPVVGRMQAGVRHAVRAVSLSRFGIPGSATGSRGCSSSVPCCVLQLP